MANMELINEGSCLISFTGISNLSLDSWYM